MDADLPSRECRLCGSRPDVASVLPTHGACRRATGRNTPEGACRFMVSMPDAPFCCLLVSHDGNAASALSDRAVYIRGVHFPPTEGEPEARLLPPGAGRASDRHPAITNCLTAHLRRRRITLPGLLRRPITRALMQPSKLKRPGVLPWTVPRHSTVRTVNADNRVPARSLADKMPCSTD